MKGAHARSYGHSPLCHTSSAPQLMYGPVSDGAGGIWGVLVVAEFVGGNTFDEETLQTFRSDPGGVW